MNKLSALLIAICGIIALGCCLGPSDTKVVTKVGRNGREPDKDGWVQVAMGEELVNGDVGVSVKSLSFPQTNDPEGQVEFEVVVFNRSETKLLPFRWWSSDSLVLDRPVLKDEHGNIYKRFVRSVASTDIHPKQSRIEKLTFTRPVAAAKWALLELPGGVCGQDDAAFKLKIDISKN